jgi:hypothetical protein
VTGIACCRSARPVSTSTYNVGVTLCSLFIDTTGEPFELGRNFLRQLKYDPKLLTNRRRLHLAMQTIRAFGFISEALS